MGIVVIGTSFMDIKGFSQDASAANGRSVGRVEYVHGGVARNVAEDIANLGLSPIFISSVDESHLGKEVVEKLACHGVNVEYMITAPNGMGTWLALFDGHGDVAGSVAQRPDTYPLLQVLEEAGDAVIADCDAVIMELDLHKDVVKKIFMLTEKYKKKVYGIVSNMCIVLERREFLHRLDYFICNDQEAGLLFSEDYTDRTLEEMRDILAVNMKSSSIAVMIVTMGAKGAVYADRFGDNGMVPVKKVVVKDTTGAGDAFCAGVVVGLTEGRNLEAAIQIGNTLAASVITSYDNVCPQFK